MYIAIDNLIVLFCAGLTLLMVMSQFVSSRRGADNLLFSAVLLCILALQLQYVLAGGPAAPLCPYAFSVHHAVWYLLGPLTWLHYRNVIKPENTPWGRALIVFIPAVTALAIELAGALRGAPDPVEGFVRLAQAHPWNMYRILKIGGLVSLLTFFCEFFVFVFRTWAPGEVPLVARYVLLTYIVPVLSVLLILAGYIFASADLERAGFTLFALQMAGWYLIGYRLPEVLLLFRRELKRKYARSLIARLDADTVLEGLRSLMDRERLFLDENLTIAALAGRLGITVHQLSELLNARMGMTFKAYVNAQRVAEAMRLLAEDRGATALAVGMSVGFNSKSAYYSAFAGVTGMTPLAYRKRLEREDAREKK